jgi:hypothetical protein
MYYTPNRLIQYKKEKILFKNAPYKSNEEFEKELFILNNDTHIVNPILDEYKNKRIEPLLQIKTKYTEEAFNKKEYGDIDFYNWLYKQKDPFLAVFAELVNAPKMTKSIETFRPKVKGLDTITIDEYIKIKRLGSKKSEWLKNLKKKYGNYILKYLKLSIS